MVSFWRVKISRFEDSKRLSSTKLPAVLFPAPPEASQAIAHLAGLKHWQPRWGWILLTWYMGEAWCRKHQLCCSSTAAVTPPAPALLPQGYRAKLLLTQELQDQTQVQESNIQWQTNHALSHSPVGFTWVRAWREVWVHMHMCTRWVSKPNNYKKVFCVFMTFMNNMHPCDHRH